MTFPYSSADDRTPPIDPPVIGPVVARRGQRPAPLSPPETFGPPLFVRGGAAHRLEASEGVNAEGAEPAALPYAPAPSEPPESAPEDAPAARDDWWAETSFSTTRSEPFPWEEPTAPTGQASLHGEDAAFPTGQVDGAASVSESTEPAQDLIAGDLDTGSSDPAVVDSDVDSDFGGDDLEQWRMGAAPVSGDAEGLESTAEPTSDEVDVFGSDIVDMALEATDAGGRGQDPQDHDGNSADDDSARWTPQPGPGDLPVATEWSTEPGDRWGDPGQPGANGDTAVEGSEPWTPEVSGAQSGESDPAEGPIDSREVEESVFSADTGQDLRVLEAEGGGDAVPGAFGSDLYDDGPRGTTAEWTTDAGEGVEGDSIFDASDERPVEWIEANLHEEGREDTLDPVGVLDGGVEPGRGWADAGEWTDAGGPDPQGEFASPGGPVDDIEPAAGVAGASLDREADSRNSDHTRGEEPDPVEQMARRLEEMVAALRAEGATGPLTRHANDPLGALITGYLLGLSGGSGAGSPPPEN